MYTTVFLFNAVIVHLDGKKTYAKAILVNFSSAFNTIVAHLTLGKLIIKMSDETPLFEFLKILTRSKRYVCFRDSFSKCTTVNTEVPRGCY